MQIAGQRNWPDADIGNPAQLSRGTKDLLRHVQLSSVWRLPCGAQMALNRSLVTFEPNRLMNVTRTLATLRP
jgi:hypothetical protein